MDLEPKLVDAPDAIELEEVHGEIEFRNVWFSYIPGEWVLQGVSFHVNPRETVAFVGSTGSGKSTILSLICRNYEFQKGEILIDGIDIRKIKIASCAGILVRCCRMYFCSPARSAATSFCGKRAFRMKKSVASASM